MSSLKLEAGVCFSSWVQSAVICQTYKEGATSGTGLSLATRQLLPHLSVCLALQPC